jgi:hypothetical protein
MATVSLCDAQTKGNTRGRNPERSYFGKSRKVKEKKVREPRSVSKARRKQEKNQEKIKRDYDNYVKDSRKRAYEIQSPEVQARMKKDKKDIRNRDKSKKKRNSSTTRSGRQKYNK